MQPLADTSPTNGFARRRRLEKRAAAEKLGVDCDFIDRLVEDFYRKIRSDDMLGPIFSTHIDQWPAHLERMKAFWRSILHNSAEFSGNPMSQHLVLPDLNTAHFSHWLDLFYQTLRDSGISPAGAELVAARARMIADSLLTGIAMQKGDLSHGRAGSGLPYL